MSVRINKDAFYTLCMGNHVAYDFMDMFIAQMGSYEINTVNRCSCFWGQCLVESGSLRWLHELWGPTPQQKRYDPPGSLARELGNTEQGDGFKYRGRGLLQTTGRVNYATLSKTIGVDLLANPDLLSTPKFAVLSALEYWKSHNLNLLADNYEVTHITKVINGGTNALTERIKETNLCKANVFS